MSIRINARTKINFKDVRATGNRILIFTATFFLDKKSQDGLLHNLAIKTPVLIPYPRARTVPASAADRRCSPPRTNEVHF